MTQITERYADKIAGVLGCFDRMIVAGTLPTLCYADGMTKQLSARGKRIFDFAEFRPTADRGDQSECRSSGGRGRAEGRLHSQKELPQGR